MYSPEAIGELPKSDVGDLFDVLDVEADDLDTVLTSFIFYGLDDMTVGLHTFSSLIKVRMLFTRSPCTIDRRMVNERGIL